MSIRLPNFCLSNFQKDPPISQNYPPNLNPTSWSFSSNTKQNCLSIPSHFALNLLCNSHLLSKKILPRLLQNHTKSSQIPLASFRSFHVQQSFRPIRLPIVSRHRLSPSSIRLHPLSSIPAAFSRAPYSTHTQRENNHAFHAVVMGRRKNKTTKLIRPRSQNQPSVHTRLTTYFRITKCFQIKLYIWAQIFWPNINTINWYKDYMCEVFPN
jgi:hypothetical protein